MKKTITLLSILSCVTCFSFSQRLSSNKDTLYTSNSYAIVKDQEIKLGVGMQPNGDFKYVYYFNNGSQLYKGNRTINSTHNFEPITVTKIIRSGSKENGYHYFLYLKNKHISRIECDIEKAIYYNEVLESSLQKKHVCNYPYCPFKNDYSWNKKGCGACDKESDCYKLDSLHFAYPNNSYEQLEYLISTKFYDGEGNEIPIEYVQLLVRSQFVLISKAEKNKLKEMFEQQ